MKSAKPAAIILTVVLALAGAGLAVQATYKAGIANSSDSASGEDWNDLRVFYGAGKMAFRDIDLYKNPASPEGRYYIFPPFFAIVCAPFAMPGWKFFVVVWVLASLGAAAGSAILCVKIAHPEASRHGRIILASLALIICARPVISDFQNGQVNSLIFFLIVLSLYLFSRKQDAASGVIMAFAASIKLTALIFLPYFIYKRAWKTTGGMLLGLAFALFVLPVLAMGPGRTFDVYPDFYEKMVGPFASVTEAPEVYEQAGQSLRAAASRFLKDTNAAHHYDGEIRVNFLDMADGTVWMVVLVASALLTLLTAFCARFDPADPVRRDVASLELGSVIMLMLLVSPMSRKAHFVAMLLPVAAALVYVLRNRRDAFRRGLSTLLLVSVIVFFILTTAASRDLLGKKYSVWLLALSTFFFATLFMWAAACIVLAGERSARVAARRAQSAPLVEKAAEKVEHPTEEEGREDH